MTPMTPHERFRACALYRPFDRVPLWEWEPWPSTLRRWQREALGEGGEPPQFAECDSKRTCAVDMWMRPRFAERVLHEDAESITKLSDRGQIIRTLKDPDATTMPQHLEYPVKTRADWEALKKRFDPCDTGRYPADWLQLCAQWRAEGCSLILTGPRSPGFFGFVRELLGPERALTAFCDEPDLIHDMMEFNAAFLAALLPRALAEAPLTAIMFWEDMCYRGGPLISPRMFREFMLPPYQRLTALARRHGVETIYVDSDGNIEQLIPLWLEAGINGMFPLEVAAGMDVAKLRRQYGRDLFCIGGIDKRVLARDRRTIDRELRRTLPLAERGGYIPHLDHAIPHDVPYANFAYYWERKKKMLGVA